VSGPNAIRGFNFQTAVAVRSALDLLADPHMAAIRVEGAQDIVDLEIIDTADATRHLAQIKARSTTTPWSAAELGAVIAEFAKVNDADQATFAFVTDGHFGPKLAEKLIPALDATAGGVSNDEQADLINSALLGWG
jgi:Cap4-like dsDNA endonuclease family protein